MSALSAFTYYGIAFLDDQPHIPREQKLYPVPLTRIRADHPRDDACLHSPLTRGSEPIHLFWAVRRHEDHPIFAKERLWDNF